MPSSFGEDIDSGGGLLTGPEDRAPDEQHGRVESFTADRVIPADTVVHQRGPRGNDNIKIHAVATLPRMETLSQGAPEATIILHHVTDTIDVVKRRLEKTLMEMLQV